MPERGLRRWAAVAPALLTVSVLSAVASHSTPAHADVAGAGGDYIALANEGHLLDTRTGLGAPAAPLGADASVSVPVLGIGGVPSSGVSGVVVDITIANNTTATYETVGPDDSTFDPATSDVNVPPNSQPVSNSAVVAVAADGKIKVRNQDGSAHVIIDVQGYYTSASASTGPGGLVLTTPTRIKDTRDNGGTGIPAGGSITVDMTTNGAIPAGATSANLDVLVLATAAGYLSAGSTASLVDFTAGTGAVGATVKISASNTVVFTNHSGATIHLVLTALGYTTGSSSTGAGYRADRFRAGVNVSVPAQGTTDVQVAGGHGVPSVGAAAVATNLTVLSGIAAGYLKAWPTDGTEPVTSLNNFAAGQTKAALTWVKPGADGKIRIRNSSSANVLVEVDVEGWYSDGVSRSVAVVANTPLSMLQPVSGGPVEGVYARSNGSLMHGTAPIDTLGNAQWVSVPSNLEAFSGQPSIVELSNNMLLVAALHSRDGEVWTFTEPASTAGAPPVSWTPTFVHTGGIMAAPPTSAVFNDGVGVTFGVDAAGQLWALASNGGFWTPIGTNIALSGTPAVVTNPSNNSIQIVGRTTAKKVVYATYNEAGAMSTWTNLGGTGVTTKPAVLEVTGPVLRVVVRQSDGSIVTKLQNPNGTFTGAWMAVPAPAGQTFIGAPTLAIDSSAGSSTNPGTGRQLILARGSDKYVYEADETGEATGTFNPFYVVPGQGAAANTDPFAFPVGGSANNYHWLAAFLDANNTPQLVHAP